MIKLKIIKHLIRESQEHQFLQSTIILLSSSARATAKPMCGVSGWDMCRIYSYY